MTETRTLEVTGAVLTYDVQAVPDSTHPTLLAIGSPMAADGFADLAARFTDRTVVRYDPRGTGRSAKADPDSPSTPEQHADDLHRLVDAIGGPVDVFASSGGAVNALAFVAKHPEQVRVLVAHEPPAAHNVPDSARALAAIERTRELYAKEGFGPAMASFIALTMHKGEFPDGPLAGPSAADLGMPTEDDGSRNDPLLGQNLISCTHYEIDVDALRAAPTRVIIAVGAESVGELAHRCALGVAERLGLQPVTFPSHHGGFTDSPWAKGDPDGFAAKLHELLD